MVKNKSGISAIVATVLIVLITVAGVTIIWTAIIPMINENIQYEEGANLQIVTSGGYTVWDEENNLASIQVKRGLGEENIIALDFIFTKEGNSKTIRREDVLGPNQELVYTFILVDFGKPDSVKVAPVYLDGSVGNVGSDVELKEGAVYTTCDSLGYECGLADDRQGGILNCSEVFGCEESEVCISNKCILPEGGGGWTERITTCEELQNMSNNLAGDYFLANDINCFEFDYGDGKGFKPVGNSSNKFSGSFDGRGYTIDYLTIDRPTEYYVGLFGYASPYGDKFLKNVNLENVNISGKRYVGGVVGYLRSYCKGVVPGEHSLIMDSVNVLSGEVRASYSYSDVGGVLGNVLAGGDTGFEIKNSLSNANVFGKRYSGGFVGYLYQCKGSSKIFNCYSTGNVLGEGSYGDYVGGFVGYLNSAFVSNSYSVGDVSGDSRVGGFVGYASGNIENSYYDGDNVNIVCSSYCNVVGNLSHDNLISSAYLLGSGWNSAEYGANWEFDDINYPTLSNSPDFDKDGIIDSEDICPLDSENDADYDGVCESVDSCPINYNPNQEDVSGCSPDLSIDSVNSNGGVIEIDISMSEPNGVNLEGYFYFGMESVTMGPEDVLVYNLSEGSNISWGDYDYGPLAGNNVEWSCGDCSVADFSEDVYDIAMRPQPCGSQRSPLCSGSDGGLGSLSQAEGLSVSHHPVCLEDLLTAKKYDVVFQDHHGYYCGDDGKRVILFDILSDGGFKQSYSNSLPVVLVDLTGTNFVIGESYKLIISASNGIYEKEVSIEIIYDGEGSLSFI